MLNRLLITFAILLGASVTQSLACTRVGSGDHLEGRVWVTEYEIKIGQSCIITFARSINQSTEKIDLTNISYPPELTVKTGVTKDGEPTITYAGTKEGDYAINYYLSSMVPGEGVEAHWQRLRVKVVK